MDIDKAIKRYREAGQKITPQRLAVMGVLEGDRTHPHAALVVERVRRGDHPYISAATVYRVLEELVAMDELARLDLGSGQMRFDPNTDGHAHLVCEGCGRVEDSDWRIPVREVPARVREGYKITGVQVLLHYRCDNCREAENN